MEGPGTKSISRGWSADVRSNFFSSDVRLFHGDPKIARNINPRVDANGDGSPLMRFMKISDYAAPAEVFACRSVVQDHSPLAIAGSLPGRRPFDT